ncbi:MAG TPA: DUF2726 domain-containing protein [Anaerolineales bacterium]
MKDSELVSTKVAILPPRRDDRLPYRLRGQFLSSPENALFRALQAMVEDRYVICPKVALNDVFSIVRPNENVHYFNKIFRKHVDFLLCEPRTMRPAFGVEMIRALARSDTRSTDMFMAEIFGGAGLPLVHVPSSERYEMPDLVNLFQLAVMRVQKADLPAVEQGDSVPMCPVCSKMMVLRMHRSGPNKGKK